jgi:hypothetical protein
MQDGSTAPSRRGMGGAKAGKVIVGLVLAVLVLGNVAAHYGLDDYPAVWQCENFAEADERRQEWLDGAPELGVPTDEARQMWDDGFAQEVRAVFWSRCLEEQDWACEDYVEVPGYVLPIAKQCQGPDDGGGTLVRDNPYLVHDWPSAAGGRLI